jgi:hypothetical protein
MDYWKMLQNTSKTFKFVEKDRLEYCNIQNPPWFKQLYMDSEFNLMLFDFS